LKYKCKYPKDLVSVRRLKYPHPEIDILMRAEFGDFRGSELLSEANCEEWDNFVY